MLGLSNWPLPLLALYLFYLAVALYVCAQMVYLKHDPIKTLSWTIVMLFLPFFGMIIYFYFGQNYRRNKIYSRKGVRDERIKKVISAQQIAQFEAMKGSLPKEIAKQIRLIKLNLNNNKSILTSYNNITPYFTGKDALKAMMESVKSAQHHIHLQSYIIENDAIGTLWQQELIQKAQQGVQVRVIYDDVGSWTLPRHYSDKLKAAGAQVESFAAVRYPWLTSKINYRNHRKILVVDGKVAYMGGVNIADRYYSGGDYLAWLDAHIKVEGEAVANLQSSFLLDWYFINGQTLPNRKQFYPNLVLPEKICYTQVITSGPDSDYANIMQSYFTAITQAKKHLYIITPYFTPNETILNAIKVASLGGVDVRIMLPEKSDATITHLSSRSYFTELMEAQVKIHLYHKGFNHSKVISIDGNFCIIGSANMDNRSFEHNFEVSTLVYNKKVTRQVDEQFRSNLRDCRQLQLKKWEKRSRKEKIFEAFARLFSPLL
ncbi:MAG: cardiolipin synthase [Bacteroidales bacterium]|nr:cardiolipin synthase [Bacteroidales bacterium]